MLINAVSIDAVLIDPELVGAAFFGAVLIDAALINAALIDTALIDAATGAVPRRHDTAMIVVKRFDTNRRECARIRGIVLFEA